MAIKQVEWKQELNKESGKWWLSALILGVLQGLLAWGSLPLAGRVWGISDIDGSKRFYLLALLISVGLSFLFGWQEIRKNQGSWKPGKLRGLLKGLSVVLLFVGLCVVIWLLYDGGNQDWGVSLQLFQDTYSTRLDLQTREYELRYRDATRLQPVIEFLLLQLFALTEVIGSKFNKRKFVLLVLSLPLFYMIRREM